MLALTQILKRRDASSVIVAIIAAFVITGMLQLLLQQPAELLSGIGAENNPMEVPDHSPALENYVFPVVLMVLQFVALELLARVVIFVNALVNKKK